MDAVYPEAELTSDPVLENSANSPNPVLLLPKGAKEAQISPEASIARSKMALATALVGEFAEAIPALENFESVPVAELDTQTFPVPSIAKTVFEPPKKPPPL